MKAVILVVLVLTFLAGAAVMGTVFEDAFYGNETLTGYVVVDTGSPAENGIQMTITKTGS